MIHKTTRKLFYKKFPYRATVYAEWARIVRLFSLKDVLNQKVDGYWASTHENLIKRHKSQIIKVLTFIEKQNKAEFKCRLESNSLNLYFMDKNLINDIKTLFSTSLRELCEPDADTLKYLLANQKSSVHKELPHGCRYKVFIRSNMNENIKANLKNYGKKNNDSIIIPGACMDYLNSPRISWWGNPLYFYVKDEKMLLLIQMLMSGSIRETHYMITDYELAKEKEKDVADS